jgi:hypothetical protein
VDAVQAALDTIIGKDNASVQSEGEGGGSTKKLATNKTEQTAGPGKAKRYQKITSAGNVPNMRSVDVHVGGPAVSESASRLQVALLEARLSSLRQKQQMLWVSVC